ncbi:MAG: acyl-CoA dehydrogenase [Clostridia bacterium]|nr:MAG: acyl-CoA dehydrogenase [Clostridia bacterium]
MQFGLTPEQQMWQRVVRDFAVAEVAPGAGRRDEEEEFDRALWNKMAGIGLTGVPFPETYGGAGADYIAYVMAIEELAAVCASTAVTLSAHTSLASWPIYHQGSEKQREKYLTALASGRELGAFALTEAGAGSDAAALHTQAVRQGDTYLLNGSKMFITNAGEAGVYIVFATVNPQLGHKGIAAFIVEPDFPGFSLGKKEKKLGIRSSPTAELVFTDCQVPAENLLAPPGQGYRLALSALDGGRIGIAAQAVGIARGAYSQALAYSRQRQQFGQPLSNFQAIQFMLADMATMIEAARLLTYQAAFLESQERPYAKEAAMAKLMASETAMSVTVKAVQIFGGYGYTRDYPVERMMRDAKITEIYEGTSEVQRMVIAASVLKEQA